MVRGPARSRGYGRGEAAQGQDLLPEDVIDVDGQKDDVRTRSMQGRARQLSYKTYALKTWLQPMGKAMV